MRLSEILSKLGGECVGDSSLDVAAVNASDLAQAGEITFAVNREYLRLAEATPATAIVVPPDVQGSGKTLIRVPNVMSYVADLLHMLHPEERPQPGVHPTAVVPASVHLGAGASIGAHTVVGDGCVLGEQCCIGPNVSLGKDCTIGDHTHIHANVSIYAGTRIGRRVLIHSGAVIGADGFGFAAAPEGLKKLRQIGTVQIDDDVEIGSNACIARASFGVTHLQAGVKIDSLVQIGHNCVIGAGSVLAGQCGLSGSVTLGRGVMFGGQVGVGDHIYVGDGARVGGQGGIVEDIPSGPRWAWVGYPARPLPEFTRENAILRKLVKMYDALRALVERQAGAAARTAADETAPDPAIRNGCYSPRINGQESVDRLVS